MERTSIQGCQFSSGTGQGVINCVNVEETTTQQLACKTEDEWTREICILVLQLVSLLLVWWEAVQRSGKNPRFEIKRTVVEQPSHLV